MDSLRKEHRIGGINYFHDSERDCGITIEEWAHEMEISKFYRALLKDNVLCHSRKLKNSKAVQTDPDTSRVPPSWLILCSELVNELHTGLCNMINSLYHAPNGYNEGDAVKGMLDHPNMKYFKYENGYWQSKVSPDIKITATARQVYAENFKNELYSLLEKTQKLQNGLPYVMEEELLQQIVGDGKSNNANKTSSKDEDYFKGGAMKLVKELPDFYLQPSTSSTDFSEISEQDSWSSFNERSPVRARKAVADTGKLSVPVISKTKNMKSDEEQICEGIIVSKYKMSPQRSGAVGISVPKHVSRSPLKNVNVRGSNNKRNGLIVIEGKIIDNPDIVFNELSHCSNNSRQMSGKVNHVSHMNQNNLRNVITDGKAECPSKNFIKMNILASKFPPQRGGNASKSIKSAKFLGVPETGQRNK